MEIFLPIWQLWLACVSLWGHRHVCMRTVSWEIRDAMVLWAPTMLPKCSGLYDLLLHLMQEFDSSPLLLVSGENIPPLPPSIQLDKYRV